WRGQTHTLGEFASRITGSSDLYAHSGRKPIASITFITAHDGFTLRDLVSYNTKHNEANLEDNRDGESHNRSWNCGVEGPTDDPEIIALRARQQRNLLTTLILSHGVRMLSHGDEIGRTQLGHNNVYCQDNELAWMDWNLGEDEEHLLGFTRRLVAVRRERPVLQRRRFFAGSADHGGGSSMGDIAWLPPAGEHMTEEDWRKGDAQAVMVFLNGQAIPEPDPRGDRIVDDSFLILFNAGDEDRTFELPDSGYGKGWHIEIDTAAELVDPGRHLPESLVNVVSRSVVVMRCRREKPAPAPT